MNIALVDIDSKLPNLALMKISAYHKAMGDNVDLVTPVLSFNDYDKVYASKIFTRSEMPCLPQGAIIGGSGTDDISLTLPPEIDELCPDYDLYPEASYYKEKHHSLGYFTRGCIRKCPWCVVPAKEGDIHPYAAVEDFIRHDRVVLMDNNVLASEHGIHQIERVAKARIKIDFNQGLDARLIDPGIARLLSKVKWLSPVRMACDTQASKLHISKAVSLLRKANVTPARYFIYVLVTDDIEDALDRISFLSSMDLSIFAQPYQDYKGTPTSRLARELASWCNIPQMRKKIPWEQYKDIRGVADIAIAEPVKRSVNEVVSIESLGNYSALAVAMEIMDDELDFDAMQEETC